MVVTATKTVFMLGLVIVFYRLVFGFSLISLVDWGSSV